MNKAEGKQRNKNNEQFRTCGFEDKHWVSPLQQDNYSKPEESDQFTGLTDKNGKEIYEGDIVHINYGNCFTPKIIDENFKVESVGWNGYCFSNKTRGIPNLNTTTPEQHIEVIGNIYKDKELLNSQTG